MASGGAHRANSLVARLATKTGSESIKLDDFDPLDWSSLHLQNLVIARIGDREGVGVLEQAHFGPHTPSGLTGFLDGFGS